MLRSHRRMHAWIWTILPVVLPLILIGALVYKATRPALPPNVQLDAPAGSEAKP